MSLPAQLQKQSDDVKDLYRQLAGEDDQVLRGDTALQTFGRGLARTTRLQRHHHQVAVRENRRRPLLVGRFDLTVDYFS